MSDIIKEIKELKHKKNAIILAHNYQREEIQEVADIVGDSLALSRAAAEVDNDTIVFCGVHFMAETAKILSPQKTVLLPVLDAGCPMADMVTTEKLRERKKEYPEAKVVCYVNSSAEVKAESDICCTSSNALKVVKSLEANQILFVPDQNLGSYVARQIPEKEIITWEGYCITHHRITMEDFNKVKENKGHIKILMHPECQPKLVELADFAGSTSQIIDFVRQSNDDEFIIGTEMGILTALQKENPNKKFYMLSPKFICSNMKKTRIQDLHRALVNNMYQIEVEDTIRQKAYDSLKNMLNLK